MIFSAPGSGEATAEFVDACSRSFLQHGAVVINNVFSPDFVEKINSAYRTAYASTIDREREVGDKRTMLAIEIEPPFSDSALYASPLVLPIIEKLLGVDFILDSYVAVTSRPNSEDQHVHVDFSHLFEEDSSMSEAVPPYALTLAIPLVPLSAMTGVTRVWPGTHRSSSRLDESGKDLMGSVSILPEYGGCYLFDARIHHGGTANYSADERPILYMVYCRPWFRDANNFYNQKPLKISAEHLSSVPEALQPLFRFAR